MKATVTTSLFAMALLSLANVGHAEISQPNLITCKGEELSLIYSASGIAGQPTFNVELEGQGYSLLGGEKLRMEHTIVGDLVSIRIAARPDMMVEYFSIVVPPVNLYKLGDTASFQTQAIRTVQHTSIGGPSFVKGAVVESTYYPVSCEGQLVRY